MNLIQSASRLFCSRCSWLLLATVVADPAPAVTIDLISVGNTGNAADTRYDPLGYGSVGYGFQIGKYEISTGQYAEFLNAVAADDVHGLFNVDMHYCSGNITLGNPWGCNIQQTGSPGSYSYSVPSDWADRPVNFVDFWSTGPLRQLATQRPAHRLPGARHHRSGDYHDIGNTALFGRNAGARFFIPTEDEWYKAAYHKNNGATGDYWDYPTQSNSVLSNVLPDPGNHANYSTGGSGYAIGPPYFRTEVGEYLNSAGPYDTFDQGGNVWEWSETAFPNGARVLRGGGFASVDASLSAQQHISTFPANHFLDLGFRVAAAIPEPTTFTLGLGAFSWLCVHRVRTRTKDGAQLTNSTRRQACEDLPGLMIGK